MSRRRVALPSGGSTNEVLKKASNTDFDFTWGTGGAGATDFLGLSDTPNSYSGQATKVVRVNAGATALEFATVAGTGDVVGPASATSGAVVLYDGTTGKLIKDSTLLPTTVGTAILNLVNPGATTFIRINADNTVTARSAADFRSDIGAQAAGSYLTSANIVGTITNGVTTNAPSEDAVFDALAEKVTGPASSLDGGAVLFNGTTGKLIQSPNSYTVLVDTSFTAGRVAIANGTGPKLKDNAALTFNEGTGNLSSTQFNGVALSTSAGATNYLKGDGTYGAAPGDVTGDDTSTTAQNIVAYSGTGGKNITELTGTQGDILYHNGTSWAKLGAGTVGQYLKTGGTGANPSWGYGAVIHYSISAGVTTTGANTTPVSVSGAVFNYVASAVYRIWVMGRLNSAAATTGAAIHFDLSSAVTAIDVNFFHQLAAGTTGTLTGGHSIADDTSAGTSSGVPTGPLDVPITGFGLLVTGANTGTCQLRLRSETTAITELLAGTVMVVERVG